MFLKSLVVRGFKSFADKTVLEFEPGITVVVGPNGSGKSNIVDAISWVLGEQGPRSLRGGKMQDVIFAGSRLRPALAMAEVCMTIDNAAGLLPIEFSEVAISRILFRSGESEYRLNGAPCRLLDIQEVLSDTGIGREQHTIIGQGQLDAVLGADALELRGFIEEAAGVGKHRRRKERALRKIAAAEHNLLRLGDLLAEIRRQLRPLREQAEIARRHAALSEERRRVSLVLASRELARLQEKIGPAGSVDLEHQIQRAEEDAAGIEESLADSERRRDEALAESQGAREAAWALSAVMERLGALGRLAAERGRSLEAERASVSEAAVRARVAELTAEREQLLHALAERTADDNVIGRRALASAAGDGVGKVEQELVPARAAHREALSEAVRIRGEIVALSASVQAAERELSRFRQRARKLVAAQAEGAGKLEMARRQLRQHESQEGPVSQELAGLERAIRQMEEEGSTLRERVRDLDHEAARWRARAGARSESSGAAQRLLACAIPGVAGVLADLVEVEAPYRHLLDALAGEARSVLVVQDAAAAARVLLELGDDEAIGLLMPGPAAPDLPGARPLRDVARLLHPAAEAALAGVYIVDGLDGAVALAAEHPHAVFLSSDGGIAFGRLATRGRAGAAARAEEVERQLAEAETAAARVKGRIESVRSQWEKAATLLNEVDADIAAAAERLSGLEREAHSLSREVEAAVDGRSRAVVLARELSERLQAARGILPEIEANAERAGALVEGLQDAYAGAVGLRERAVAELDEVRIGLARSSERRRLLEERLVALTPALARAALEAPGVESRRGSLAQACLQAASIAEVARILGEGATLWADQAQERHRALLVELEEVDGHVGRLRSQRTAAARLLEESRARARVQDLHRSEMRIRARILQERMRTEWDVDPDSAVDTFGHRWEVEDESRLSDPLERAAAMEDEALRRKLGRLERELGSVGHVNPLAGQEYEALTEREAFLNDQLADVRAGRRDLLKVVASVEERIKDIFGAAFEDVSREYERLFDTLFPGGQGRLRLTEPSDLLETGVEIEARPGGKNLRRLSLLSGGERALSALAFAFAIFRARSSPFYVLDEVEAALDDVNLHRFLGLLREFREASQILVVTHQKRTMEAADVLYGVSIRPDGASRMICERLAPAGQAGGLLADRWAVPAPEL